MMSLTMREDGQAQAREMSTTRPSMSGADISVGAWDRQVVRRLGNPPYRFNGRRICWHWRALDPDQHLEIAVWERQRGGFVLGYSCLKDGAVRAAAFNFKEWSDAVDHLEHLCSAKGGTGSFDENLFDLLSTLHAELRFHQQFEVLVGDVLADWETFLMQKSQIPSSKEPFQ